MRIIAFSARDQGLGALAAAGGRKSGAWLVTVGILVALILPVPAAQAAQSGPRATAGASRGGTAQSTGSGDAVLDVVMLVDESGSETGERSPTRSRSPRRSCQSMLNPRQPDHRGRIRRRQPRGPGPEPDQRGLPAHDRQRGQEPGYLSTCAGSLHRRGETEGNDTDYAAALGQAMCYLNPDTAYGQQSPPGAIKVILMMTDGGVDVHRDTQQYGQDWLAGEHQAVNEQLTARAAGPRPGVAARLRHRHRDATDRAVPEPVRGARRPVATCGMSPQPHATW